jgi:hypothetical protein
MRSEHRTLERLRHFLLLLALWLYLGTIIELIAAGHDKSLIQLIPFALCGVGILALGAIARGPGSRALLIVRGTMLLVVGGSLLGMYEHLAGNYAFAQEVHPRAHFPSLIEPTLRGGDPILAPGILAAAAAVTLAATWTSSDRRLMR